MSTLVRVINFTCRRTPGSSKNLPLAGPERQFINKMPPLTQSLLLSSLPSTPHTRSFVLFHQTRLRKVDDLKRLRGRFIQERGRWTTEIWTKSLRRKLSHVTSVNGHCEVKSNELMFPFVDAVFYSPDDGTMEAEMMFCITSWVLFINF